MIPFGKPCPVCKKLHIIKPIEVWDNLTPKEKTQGYNSGHRFFRDGYYRSLDRGNEVWEFYLPLTIGKTFMVVQEEKKSETLEEEYSKFVYYADED